MKILTFCVILMLTLNIVYGQTVDLKNINVVPGANNYQVKDINADGLLDIISVGIYWDTEVYLNEGNFKFKYINIDSSSGIKETFSNQIGFIDYNKDGKSDFVHTNCPACGDRGVNLYENNQFSTFTKKTVIAPNPETTDIIYDALDINKDGFDDLVVNGTKCNYYLNNNGLGFKPGVQLISSVEYDYIHHQDLNSDGYQDIIAKGGKDMYLYISNNGVFSNPIKIPGFDTFGYLFAKDLNNDGILDYFLSQSSCIKVIYSNKGKAEYFDPIVNVACGASTDIRPAFVDIDGDGDFDVIHGKTAGDGLYLKVNNSGVYAASKLISSEGFQNSIHIVADFNNDGKEDILFRNKFSLLGIYENLHNPNEVKLHVVADEIRDFAIGDLNSDGKDDILCYYDKALLINHQNENGFSGSEQIYLSEYKSQIIRAQIYDIDNDSDNDIFVILEPDATLGQKPTLIWLENLNNTFTKINTILTGKRDLSNLTFFDVDKDGDTDIIVIKTLSTGFVLKNNGSSTFESSAFNGLGDNIKIFDLNKDGYEDMVTWNLKTAYYLENNKAGGVLSSKTLFKLDLIHDLEFFDFDSDGDFDIIANGYLNFESVLNVYFNENLLFTNIAVITKQYSGTCLELSSTNNSSKPTVITGSFLERFKHISGGNFDFSPGLTPLYTYGLMKPIVVNGENKLIASGGENNGYIIEISGIYNPILTSITDVTSQSEKLVLYPNPTNGIINFSNEDFEGVTLYDAVGIKMTYTKEKFIDMTNYRNGIYFLLFDNGYKAKVIKM